MASSKGDGGSEGKKDGKRGVTRMRKLHKAKIKGFKYEVRWNALGHPVGENSQEFVSYIGFIVRWYIPISMENWRSEEMKPYKQKVLEEIRKVFIFGEEREHFVKMEAGKLFRAFKTMLAKFYMRDSNGDVVAKPLDHKYPRIDQEHWDAFVARRLSPDFQKISKGNKERALNPKYPYTKSRLGFGRLTEKMAVIPIFMEKDIFGQAFSDEINKENIRELVEHQWLSATVITVYARYLYDKIIKSRGLVNKFAFLSPHLSEEDKQGQQIADILKTHKFKNKLILAPVNIGQDHWVLVVINRGAEIIYFMDSLPRGHHDYGPLRQKFMNAMCICRAHCPKSKSKSSKIGWLDIKCPKQTNSIDCVYFVMRFMKEIILENQANIPDNYFTAHQCKTYSKDKLAEVEEDWAAFMVEYIRQYGVSTSIKMLDRL